jgi:hypothetical protein
MGEDFDGFKIWIKTRREELAGSLTYQLLVSNLDECTSHQELQGFLTKHGEAVGELESRKFEALYDEKAAALKMVAQASV